MPMPVEEKSRWLRRNRTLSSPQDSEIKRVALEGAREGWRLFLAGDYEGAIAAYSEAIALDPNFETAYRERSVAFRRLGHKNREEARIQAQNQTTGITAKIQQGIDFLKSEDFEGALSTFSDVISLEPDSEATYGYRAKAYRSLGMDKEADADIQAVASIRKRTSDGDSLVRRRKQLWTTAARVGIPIAALALSYVIAAIEHQGGLMVGLLLASVLIWLAAFTTAISYNAEGRKRTASEVIGNISTLDLGLGCLLVGPLLALVIPILWLANDLYMIGYPVGRRETIEPAEKAGIKVGIVLASAIIVALIVGVFNYY